MLSSIVLRLTGWVLLIGGVALLAAPGEIAVALGTPGPMPVNGASDPLAMTFWRQLTFIRMFGTAAIGLGAICLWCRAHLTRAQHGSFLKVLAGVLAFMCWMAVSQQQAIWSGTAGWTFVVVLGITAAACIAALAAHQTKQVA